MISAMRAVSCEVAAGGEETKAQPICWSASLLESCQPDTFEELVCMHNISIHGPSGTIADIREFRGSPCAGKGS